MPSALHKMATMTIMLARSDSHNFNNVFLAFFSVIVSSLREVSRKNENYEHSEVLLLFLLTVEYEGK